MATVAAAPAFAASVLNCTVQTVSWGSRPDGTRITTINSTPATGTTPTTTLTAAAVVVPPLAASNINLTTNTDQQGGTAPNLILQMERTTPNSTPSETVTLTFVPPVSNLSFTILDIDSSNNTPPNAGLGIYYDYVSLVSAPNIAFTRTSAANNVVGSGTVADPFHYSSNNVRVPADQTAGNVTVNFPGPVSTITLNYFSTVPMTIAQMQIALSNFTFQQAGC